jgi:hydrogenase maturation protease
MNMKSYLVLAIGNTLLSDDGVGAKVLEYLQRNDDLPADVRLVDGGTLSFSLATELDDLAGLIVVDASRFRSPPGAFRCFIDAEMDAQLQGGGRSVHEVGLSDLLDIARLTGQLPERIALVGVEPLETDWGEELSPPVQAAVPEAAALVTGLIDRWRCDAGVESHHASQPTAAGARA